MVRHWKHFHLHDRPTLDLKWECKYCSKKFSNRFTGKYHIQKDHPDQVQRKRENTVKLVSIICFRTAPLWLSGALNISLRLL